VAADVAGDLAAAGGVADVDGIFEVEVADEFGEIVGVGVEVVAVEGLARPWPRRSWATQRKPWLTRKFIWSSKSSEFKGQPWLKTTGCPDPQSL
jgi:hypothetical protein